jgi:surface polysaccharide O-acyltransferase-like enzyme
MAILIVMLDSFASKDGHPLLDFEISQCFTRVAVPFFFITSGFLLFRKMPLNLSEKDQKWLGLKDTFKF